MIQSVWLSAASLGFSVAARHTQDEFESEEIVDLTPSPPSGGEGGRRPGKGGRPHQNCNVSLSPNTSALPDPCL
jgi:hypothetical protein